MCLLAISAWRVAARRYSSGIARKPVLRSVFYGRTHFDLYRDGNK
ncbi:MAG TPA: hypothetical protein PLA91_04395 [Bacillota bacterium]|nr:hypothetical protein [Bacillota bacterium]